MATAVPNAAASPTSDPSEDVPEVGDTARRLLLGATAVRILFAAIAVPLAPALYRDSPLALVALRPTKEVLAFAGFQIRRGELAPVEVAVASIPLALLGVWVMFGLGRAYLCGLRTGDDELPGLAGRVLPRKKVSELCELLGRKGVKVIVLGRLAAFPSSLLAAAAGGSGMAPRTFLVADTVGFVVSATAVTAAGWALGAAYERSGPWVTGVGVVVAAGLAVALGRWLRRGDGQPADEAEADASSGRGA